MEVKKAKIGNALTSSAANHVVAVSEDIYDESKGRYQSDINEDAVKSKIVADKAAADIGVNSITLLRGGIDSDGSENTSNYFLRTTRFITFKLEVNSGYTIGQLAQYDLYGNFVALHSDRNQLLEGVSWTSTTIVVSDKNYYWVAIVFKGDSPTDAIYPQEDVVKTFLSGFYLFAEGGEGDSGSSAAKAKAIARQEINSAIDDLPNEEDLELVNGKMQLANRAASFKDSKVANLGYVILRPNKSFAEQVIDANTIYEVRYEYNLTEGFKFPDNCVLKFEGGLLNINLSSGTVNFNNLTIDASDEVIIKVSDTSVIEGGLNNSEILSEWFNIVEDGADKRHILNQLFWWVGKNQTIRFKKGDAVKIDGGEIRVNKSGVTVKDGTFNIVSCNGLFLVNADNITFDNCRFVGTEGNTCSQIILLGTSNNILISDCYFSYVGYAIIQTKGKASNNVTVTGCLAENMTADFVEANCTSTAPSYNWVIANNIYLGDVNYPALKRENRFVGVTDVKNIIIKDNIVKRTAGDAAVHIEETDKDVTITGNQFENCVDKCVWILNARNRAIISNNIFRVTDNALTTSKFFTNESEDNLIENFGKHLFTANYCIGLKSTDDYIGNLYCANSIIIDNIFCSIKGVNAFTYTEIKNNKFIDCKNCLTANHNAKEISYCDNVDVNTEAYSISLKSASSDLQNIVLKDNIFSGAVEVGDTSDTCVFENNIYTSGQYVSLNAPIYKNYDRGVYKNNYVGNCQHDNFVANIKASDGLMTKFSNAFAFENNRLKFAIHNGQTWYDAHTPHMGTTYPAIFNKGSLFFDENYNKLLICTVNSEEQSWTVAAPSETTAAANGYVKLSIDNTSLNIDVKEDETWSNVLNRLLLHKLAGCQMLKTSNNLVIRRLFVQDTSVAKAPTIESDVFTFVAPTYTQSNVAATWRDINGNIPAPNSGDTRPANASVGFQFFDTALNKPIWWNGAAWVDSTGTEV